jgi:hypothetical protein
MGLKHLLCKCSSDLALQGLGKTTPSPYFLVRLGNGTKERTIKQKTVRMAVFCYPLTLAFIYDTIEKEVGRY